MSGTSIIAKFSMSLMFPVMKCGMACTIVPHSLYVLQNVQGADIRYN